MLEAVGLGERLHHKPEQLSGGQRQRVAIARALVSEPAIIMADEPTASLDKQSGREVVDRMRTLAKEHGATILLVTHDNRILDIADRIVHLEDGHLSTFADAVIANNQHMMKMLAANRRKQPIGEMVDGLDEHQFSELLEEITNESQRFLEATSLASNTAFRSMLEQGLFAFTRKLGGLLNAERSSLFLVEGGFPRSESGREPASKWAKSAFRWAPASPAWWRRRGRPFASTTPTPTPASTARWTGRPGSAPAPFSACRSRTSTARSLPWRSCSIGRRSVVALAGLQLAAEHPEHEHGVAEHHRQQQRGADEHEHL
jgi:energy-coupling factor transporter ATP-binding protein EcfA2